MKKIILACALFLLIVNYGIGQSNHTVTFSGSSSDFSAAEKYSATAGSTDYYITFDANYLYIGAFRTSGSFGSTDNLAIYIDTDPVSTPTSGTGTTTGQSYNSVSGTLPFSANYNVHAEQSYQEARSFGSSWASTISGLTYWTNSTAREVKIPFSSIGSPKALYLTMWMGYNSGFFSNVPGANIGASGNPPIVSYFGGIGVTSAGCYPKNITDDPITGSLIDAAPATGAKYGYLGSTTGSNTATGDFSVASGGSIVVSGGALDISGRIVTMASGTTINNTATFTTTGSTLTFNGIGTVSGTVGLKDVNIAGGVNFGASSTINGTLTINPGGYVNTNVPTYADGSTLVYNAGTPYDRSAEWAAGSSGVGVPYNVKVNSSFSLNMDRGSGTGDARTVRGKLTLAGSMSFKGTSNGGNGTVGGLTVNGDLLMEGGTLTLGHYINPNGSDLVLFGNWDRTGGSFVGNGRAVFLDGTTNTAITTNTATVINYLYVRKTASASVTLNNELQVANVANVNNGATLNCGAFPITGIGTFTLSSGATLGVGSANGISSTPATGNIQVTSTRTFDAGANYNFNGEVAQVTGSGFPATVNNFSVNNSAVGGVSLSSNLTVSNNLTISGGILKVPATKALTVSGILANATAANLVIQSDATGTGSLKHSTAGVSATFERYMNNADWLTAKDGWHFLSSPVASQAISPNFVTTPDTEYDFYCWYEPSNLWVNYKNTVTAPTWNTANGSLNFTVGKGYMAAYNTEGTKVFSGTLNVTDVPIAGLTITGTSQANRSWHLLGNPFACAITWDATSAWNLTNIAGIANIWNEATQSYTPITSVVPMSIPATNGFMVQASGGTGSLTIPASKRDHAAQAFYKSSTVIPQITLVAKTADGTSEQISKVMVYSDATEGFDLMYDGEFLPGFAPLFYSKLGDLNLSVNCLPSLPAESMIPFGFVKNDATNFSIELKESMEGYEVFLKDLKTNTDQNLTENPVYTFTSEAGDDANRFLLHFLSTVGTTEQSCPEALRIYANAGNIYLSGATGKAEVLVRNMLGQTVMQRSVNGDALKVINAENLKAGVYIVSVVSSVQTISTKVIIK